MYQQTSYVWSRCNEEDILTCSCLYFIVLLFVFAQENGVHCVVIRFLIEGARQPSIDFEPLGIFVTAPSFSTSRQVLSSLKRKTYIKSISDKFIQKQPY